MDDEEIEMMINMTGYIPEEQRSQLVAPDPIIIIKKDEDDDNFEEIMNYV